MPRCGSEEDSQLIRAMERWQECVVENVDEIRLGNASDGKPYDGFRGDTYTIATSYSHQFRADPATFFDLFGWVTSWFEQVAGALPAIAIINRTEDRAILMLATLHDGIQRRMIRETDPPEATPPIAVPDEFDAETLGAFGLRVRKQSGLVKRDGRQAVAEFAPGSAELFTFLIAFKSGEAGATEEEWMAGYPAEPESRRQLRQKVNVKLRRIGLRTSPGFPMKLQEIEGV